MATTAPEGWHVAILHLTGQLSSYSLSSRRVIADALDNEPGKGWQIAFQTADCLGARAVRGINAPSMMAARKRAGTSPTKWPRSIGSLNA